MRVYVFAALMLAGTVFARVGLPSADAPKTEQWMEANSLKAVDRCTMVPASSGDPDVTYKMTPDTYKELAAYGIVCRELSDGVRLYDVVLIASQAKASFHDPRVCFSAQGWDLQDESTVLVSTKSRGVVPVSIAEMKSEEGARWGAYFYRGPYGFAPNTNDLKLQMFKYSLLHSKASDGVFYRFIAEDEGATQQDLVNFISKYLDASGKASQNYF
jgi:hypothetical protein